MCAERVIMHRRCPVWGPSALGTKAAIVAGAGPVLSRFYERYCASCTPSSAFSGGPRRFGLWFGARCPRVRPLSERRGAASRGSVGARSHRARGGAAKITLTPPQAARMISRRSKRQCREFRIIGFGSCLRV